MITNVSFSCVISMYICGIRCIDYIRTVQQIQALLVVWERHAVCSTTTCCWWEVRRSFVRFRRLSIISFFTDFSSATFLITSTTIKIHPTNLKPHISYPYCMASINFHNSNCSSSIKCSHWQRPPLQT
jgi:hypothetical protein